MAKYVKYKIGDKSRQTKSKERNKLKRNNLFNCIPTKIEQSKFKQMIAYRLGRLLERERRLCFRSFR